MVVGLALDACAHHAEPGGRRALRVHTARHTSRRRIALPRRAPHVSVATHVACVERGHAAIAHRGAVTAIRTGDPCIARRVTAAIAPRACRIGSEARVAAASRIAAADVAATRLHYVHACSGLGRLATRAAIVARARAAAVETASDAKAPKCSPTGPDERSHRTRCADTNRAIDATGQLCPTSFLTWRSSTARTAASGSLGDRKMACALTRAASHRR
jgi:hypothetical protein